MPKASAALVMFVTSLWMSRNDTCEKHTINIEYICTYRQMKSIAKISTLCYYAITIDCKDCGMGKMLMVRLGHFLFALRYLPFAIHQSRNEG